MVDINLVAVVVAAIAAFAFAGAYYSVLAGRLATLGPAWAEPASTPAWQPVVFELVKGVVIAIVVAGLVEGIPVAGIAGALSLTLVLWVSFPVLILAGSVVHERAPARLAAIHAGDWLAKLVIIALIVTIWP